MSFVSFDMGEVPYFVSFGIRIDVLRSAGVYILRMCFRMPASECVIGSVNAECTVHRKLKPSVRRGNCCE